MDTLRRPLSDTQPIENVAENDKLTPKQEKFAQIWADSGNQSKAYREAFEVSDKTPPGSIWGNASKMAAIPKVKARFEELRAKTLERTIVSISEALQWQYDIATADPNDLVRTVLRNCRYCRGADFRYQWKDDEELLNAQVLALEKNKPSPDVRGGFGFDGSLEPVPNCPHCYGAGIKDVVIADTTKLEGKALKLYAGAEQDRFGVVKIKMHDQQAAWDKVCRMMGAFNDKLDVRTPAQRAADEAKGKMAANVTIEEAQKAYLSLLG